MQISGFQRGSMTIVRRPFSLHTLTRFFFTPSLPLLLYQASNQTPAPSLTTPSLYFLTLPRENIARKCRTIVDRHSSITFITLTFQSFFQLVFYARFFFNILLPYDYRHTRNRWPAARNLYQKSLSGPIPLCRIFFARFVCQNRVFLFSFFSPRYHQSDRSVHSRYLASTKSDYIF